MKYFQKNIYFLAYLLLVGTSLYAGEKKANGLKEIKNRAPSYYPCTKYKAPFEQPGSEGEGGGIVGGDKVLKTVKVYKDKSKKSPVVDSLKKGEELPSLSFITVTKKFGRMKVSVITDDLAEEYKLREGDTVDAIFNIGEGHYTVCFGNEEAEAVEGLRESNEAEDRLGYSSSNKGSQFGVENVSFGVSEQWVELTTDRGKTGFVPGSEHFFFGHYD